MLLSRFGRPRTRLEVRVPEASQYTLALFFHPRMLYRNVPQVYWYITKRRIAHFVRLTKTQLDLSALMKLAASFDRVHVQRSPV